MLIHGLVDIHSDPKGSARRTNPTVRRQWINQAGRHWRPTCDGSGVNGLVITRREHIRLRAIARPRPLGGYDGWSSLPGTRRPPVVTISWSLGLSHRNGFVNQHLVADRRADSLNRVRRS